MMHMKTSVSVVLLLGLAAVAAAQNVTTGSLSGTVRDAQGGVLPGATVVAIHTPTGTTYEGVTQSEGRFTLLNVRVGGPYEITVGLQSFKTQVIGNVNVALGESSDVPVTLQLEALAETVTVTAEASSVFTPSKSGTTATVDQATLENLPTVARSIQDFARLSPFFNQIASNANPASLSVAGRNTRYNNIQIDGAVNNDVFGIADSGTPGGQADTQPISIDAIQELQLLVSPYDVRQGNFSGGGVNAITKSGSNRFKGGAFSYFRDQSLVGTGVDRRPIATFSDKQFGGTLGGPVRKNKMFFFTTLDWGRKQTPSGYSISGTSGQSFGRQSEAERFLGILRTRYGYTPGDTNEFIRETNNDKIFVRTDFNIRRSQLTVRHNFVDGFNDVGTQSNTTYKFADNFYRFNSKTNSTVGQLNSVLRTTFNELRLTVQRIREFRTTPNAFPEITVRLPGGGNLVAGTEQFSAANELDQDVFELNDDVTMVRGKHTVTIGTHNEFIRFRNLFIRDNFGTYTFEGLDNLDAGVAQGFVYSFSLTGDPRLAARFSVKQLGLYAGDQWRVANRLSIYYGLRVDTPNFGDPPTANPDAQRLYGFATDVVPNDATWSPRMGFNLDLSGSRARRQQVRGGFGLMGGRTPYVWLSNQYGNTGIEFRRLFLAFNTANRVQFVADPHTQPTTVGGASANEIDVIDPDYGYPRQYRGNLAYDRSFPFGLIGSSEIVFSTTVKDIAYKNLNLLQIATRPDGRPFFGRVNPAYSDVVLLTNTDQGNNYSIATKVEKPFRNGWYASGSYIYGRSKSVNDGGSSQARSNWINTYTAGDINNPPLATSNFDVRHRFNIAASYQFNLRLARVTTSIYYNGQSGRPYSYNFGTDVNGDGSTTNDLLYIPREGEVTVTNATYQDLIAFINAGNCGDEGATPGAIVKRNTCRAPWVNTLDFKLAVRVPVRKVETEVTFDLLNLLNLIDRTNGLLDYALFNDLLPVNASFNATTNTYTYGINSVARPGGVRFTRDDLRSRWQGQVGLRLRF